MGMAKDIVGLIGAGAASESQRQSNLLNDKQLENEGIYADQGSADAYQRGGVAAGNARMSASRASSAQRLAYSNSGVDAGIGTALATEATTEAMGEYNAQVAGNNAAREAWGHDAVKQSVALKRRLLQVEGDAQKTGAMLSTTGSAISFVGDAAKMDSSG